MRNKFLWVLVVGFAFFFILQSPQEAAELVREALAFTRDVIDSAATAFAEFIRNLT
ncbi:MAG: hypothetical protein KY434_04985 [Actinobacteria bacterium]|nr:hypothetical protein [Actinomycetota bacterium]